MRKRPLLILAPAVLGLVLAGLVSTKAADSKEIITFQCRLVNNGVPVNATDLDLTFEVWSLETGGDPEDADERVHDEDHEDVTVANGLLSVRLGEQDGNPLTGVFTKYPTLWVMVKITGGVDLLPARIKLSAVPYSMNAARASSLMDASGSVFYTSDFLQSSTSGSETTVNGQQATLVIQASETDIATGTITLHGNIDVTNTLQVGEVIELTRTSTPSGVTGTNIAVYAKSDGNIYKYDGTDETQIGSGGGGNSPAQLAGGRLSASSSEPVPTTDITNTTLYYLPYKSKEVSLWDSSSSAWSIANIGTGVSFSNATLDLDGAAIDEDENYDVYLYDDSGTSRLGLMKWSGDTSRQTGKEPEQDSTHGVYVLETDKEKRYLGTVRTILDSSVVKFTDAEQRRFVWNVDNRVHVVGLVNASSLWTLSYNQTSWRVFDNDATRWRLRQVVGLPQPIDATIHIHLWNVSGGGAYHNFGLGYGNGAIPSTPDTINGIQTWSPSDGYHNHYPESAWSCTVSEGLNVLQPMEQGQGTSGYVQIQSVNTFFQWRSER